MTKSLKKNSKDYAELDKAYRKLSKEHKDLQAKHMKDCSEVKVLKDDNKEIVKEGNAHSVALKSYKKDLDLTLKTSGKEIEALKEELATLKEFKIQQQEEKRKVQKQEKKKGKKTKRNVPRLRREL